MAPRASRSPLEPPETACTQRLSLENGSRSFPELPGAHRSLPRQPAHKGLNWKMSIASHMDAHSPKLAHALGMVLVKPVVRALLGTGALPLAGVYCCSRSWPAVCTFSIHSHIGSTIILNISQQDGSPRSALDGELKRRALWCVHSVSLVQIVLFSVTVQ